MFRSRSVSFLIEATSIRYYTAKAILIPVEKSQRTPVITCKNTKLNLYSNDTVNTNVKFGQLPLASKGWKHRKSKGDCFIFHPTVSEEEIYNCLEPLDSLNDLKIDSKIITNLKENFDVERLTKVQEKAIPLIVNMNHVLVAAETGCGKTLAYLVPIIQQILDRKAKGDQREMNTPFALLLTPGRELASQIGRVTELLSEKLNLNVKVILGGNTKKLLLNPTFENIDILIGSIGAISKLITNKIYRTESVRHVVLDEADTLLDDSFSQKLGYLLQKFPFYKNHIEDPNNNTIGTQLIMASATMPININDRLKQIIDTETIHEVASPKLHHILPHIKQKFVRMNKSDRPGQLLSLVKAELSKNRPLIIFGNKTAASDYISIFLNNSGLNCVNLNGDMPMNIRVGQFEKFQTGKVNVLSTTDVSSRGLDTTRARHVINFDFPLHVADYIHRCGRIGRVGAWHQCMVTNFISSQSEIDTVQKIEHAARTGGLLPQVNANITNIIHKKVIDELKEIEKEYVF